MREHLVARLRTMLAATTLLAFCEGAPLIAVAAQQANNGTATFVGHVFNKGSKVPLGFSTVSIEGIDLERFSDATGRFVFEQLPIGKPLRIRVRHLGYVQIEKTVTLPAGLTDSTTFELAPTPSALAVVEVRSDAKCTAPGAPSFGTDSNFTAVFGEVLQNADQYRLLSTQYPFELTLERVRSSRSVSGMVLYDAVSRAVYWSQESWKYEAGKLSYSPGDRYLHSLTTVIPTTTPQGQATVHEVRIPTLDQFASRAFVANHCFFYKGLETVDSSRLARVDFVAAERIGNSDVNGSLYLDPVTYQMRRSVLRLSRPSKEVKDMTSLEVTTVFTELMPGIPVASSIAMEVHYKTPKDSLAKEAVFETQKLLDVKFRKGKPGDRP